MKRSVLRQEVPVELFDSDFCKLRLWNWKEAVWIMLPLLFKSRAWIKSCLQILKQWMHPRHGVISLANLRTQELQIQLFICHQVDHVAKTDENDQDEYSD
jgi:hypothetical protein